MVGTAATVVMAGMAAAATVAEVMAVVVAVAEVTDQASGKPQLTKWITSRSMAYFGFPLLY